MSKVLSEHLLEAENGELYIPEQRVDGVRIAGGKLYIREDGRIAARLLIDVPVNRYLHLELTPDLFEIDSGPIIER